ncbi:MAG: hypothetical protein ACYCS8_12750 [Acidithiobacillus sp.]
MGKSRLAMVLVDYLLTKGRNVVVVEGDRTGADVGVRYREVVATAFLNLNRPDAMEDAFADLTNALEAFGDADVVVNLPGQASDTLDQFAEMFASVAEALGHDLVIFYSIGNLDMHVKNLAGSLESGLLSVVPPANRIVVLGEINGKPENFAWRASPVREHFLGLGGKESVMPKLKLDKLEEKLRVIPGGYSAMLAADGTSPLDKLSERFLLERWLIPAHACVAVGVINDEGGE